MELKPGYRQTEVGVIPEDWEPRVIGDVVGFSGGSQPPRSTFLFTHRDGYLRLIQIRDYKTDEFATYIPEALARKRCSTDDIMIGRYGPPIFQILRGIEGAYNVAIIKAIPSATIDREYLFHFLKQDSLFRFVEALSQRSSGQTGIEMPALRGYRLPLPPLPEQRSIAAALSDVDALITGLNQLIAKKRDLKQAAMQQLLTGKQRLPGFCQKPGYKQTEIGVMPEDWRTITIERLCIKGGLVRGPFGGTLKKEYFVDDGYKVYEQKNAIYRDAGLGTYFINEKKYNELKRFEVIQGDFIISCSGTIGRIFQIPKHAKKGVINQALLKIKTDSEIIHDGYFFYVFDWENFQKRIIDNTQGGAMQNLVGMSIFRNITIFLPFLPEQRAIATVLADMDGELAALEQRRDKTQALKQGMMQELLTGRIRLV